MRATSTLSPLRQGRRRLLGSCAIAAGLAALALGGPAEAQVAGTGQIVSGSGTIDPLGPTAPPNTTQVEVAGPQTIINWTPTDSVPTGGAIDFLPAGNTLEFYGTDQYTVLNRFVDAGGGSINRQVALNGTVNSYIGSPFASGGNAQGGNIWFYNAGGILIGGGAAINVGSLLLTSNDIDTTGGLFGSSGEIRFRGASASTSTVEIASGANVNAAYPGSGVFGANPGGSYVALVAPRIVQNGTVTTDGSTAYVAAEQADIRINNGLFDINVLVGAEGGNVITHGGVTTGPAHEQGDIDQSRVYMVAIPKNDAVTMLVSGQIGYQDAVVAQTDPDGAVRLSAGFNITNGDLEDEPVNATAANITVNDTLFLSDTLAHASGAFAGQPLVTPPTGGPFSPPPHLGQLVVQGSGVFIGDASASLTVGAGQLAGATGDLTILSGGTATAPGNASVTVDGGVLAAVGTLDIIASGLPQVDGSVVGGTASLTVLGGTAVSNNISVRSNGAGRGGVGGPGGNGTGGAASILVSGAGAALIADSIAVEAEGSGSNATNIDEPALTGGYGTGGSATLTVADGGSLSASDMLRVNAAGIGGDGRVQAGDGTGGNAAMNILGGTLDAPNVEISATGAGGRGGEGDDASGSGLAPPGSGGRGTGGSASVTIDGAAALNTSSFSVYAGGTGGQGGDFYSFTGLAGDGGTGGDGIGGTATITVAAGTLDTGSLIADAAGFGGEGGNVFASGSGGPVTGTGVGGEGGDGLGGMASIDLSTEINSSDSLISTAQGVGGQGGFGLVGGNGGNGVGGTAEAIINNFDAGIFTGSINAQGVGGNGAFADDGAGGNGGSGTGGTARLRAEGAAGQISLTQENILSGGIGGNGGSGSSFFTGAATGARGGDGGDGTGGTLEIIASGGARVGLGDDTGSAVGFSSVGAGGNGGDGAFNANGPGTSGGDGGTGGAGNGGTIHMLADGGTIGSGGLPVDITSEGFSGAGGTGGTGTDANGAEGSISPTAGGRIIVEAAPGGSVDFGSTTLAANGDTAGRIELRAGGSILVAGLEAEALGLAAPTSNDTDTAPAGIFVAVESGSVSSAGAATLTTDSSVGVYASGNGQFTVGSDLTIDAVDQIDIRHDARAGTAATIGAAGEIILTAQSGISGAPGSLIDAEGALSLDAAAGPITVDRLHGAEINLVSAGDTYVEHAEADGNFFASAANFGTGLNSIITGGDITIFAADTVDLGNSSAGGYVSVMGEAIAFNAIDAGTTVTLFADSAAGAGITGGDITAGDDITLRSPIINLSGTVQSSGSLRVTTFGGDLAIAQSNVAGDIALSVDGDVTGTYRAGGNVLIRASGDAAVEADAAGTYVSSSGIGSEGYVFVDAEGDATLTDSSAATMLGVRSGGATSVDGASAGEDIFILAGTGATLADVTAGDDLEVSSGGAMAVSNAATTGTGADDRRIVYETTPASGSAPPITILQIQSSAADGADINLNSSGGTITGSGLSAGDDIFLAAATAISVNGAETLGLGVTGGDSSIRTQSATALLGDLSAADDVVVEASGAIDIDAPVIAGRDIAINAGSVTTATLTDSADNLVNSLAAGRDLAIVAAGAIDTGAVAAGRDLAMIAGTTIDTRQAVSGAGGTISLNGNDGVTGERVVGGGATDLASAEGAINVADLESAGPVTASADSIQIAAVGPLDFGLLETDVGNAFVETTGNLSVATAAIAGTADLRARGSLAVGELTAMRGNFVAEGDMTLGPITVARTLVAEAGGLLTINNALLGEQISVGSGDITIGVDGSIGAPGITELVEVRNTDPTATTFIGGTGTRAGYHIDSSEMTRLFGNRIGVFAPGVDISGSAFVASAPGALLVPIASVGSSAPPDVVIDDFTMTAGGSASNLGATGSLSITTAGKVRVIGDVSLTGMGDNNALNIFADDALEVILGEGSIRLSGATIDAPAGLLRIESDDVIVATLAAIGDVAAAPTIGAIEQRLAQNDGVTSDDGALYAGGITVRVVGGFYVQNSGAGTDFSERRGMTFGAGGLNVNTVGSRARVVINGVNLGAQGQITGRETIPLLTVRGAPPTAADFDRRSSLNGCAILSPVTCVAIDSEGGFPVQDVIEEESNDDSSENPSLPTALITMRAIDPLTGEPLLDDPVTGAGNDDLWTPPGE